MKNHNDNKRLGQEIRAKREAQGFSQEKFAELLNVKQPTLSLYEAGKRKISAHLFKKMVDILCGPTPTLPDHGQASPAAPTTISTINNDQLLTDQQKKALISLYRDIILENANRETAGKNAANPNKKQARQDQIKLENMFNDYFKNNVIEVYPKQEYYSKYIKDILSLFIVPGLTSIDIRDVLNIFGSINASLLFSVNGTGKNKTKDLTKKLKDLFKNEKLSKTKGFIFNIIGGPSMKLSDINEINETIYKFLSPKANVIFGSIVNEKFKNKITTTALAAF